MQETAPSKENKPQSGKNGADFCFVISSDLSDHTPELLRMAKTAFPDLEISVIGDLPAGRERGSLTCPLIVPVATPAEALAFALINRQPPAVALESWTRTAQNRLAEYRGARRQIKLLALAPLLEGSAESWATLAAQIGRPAPAALPEQTKEAPQNGADSLHQLIAAYLLQSAHEAQALASEIEAMIHGPLPASENPLQSIAGVLDYLRDQQARLDNLVVKDELLRENLALLSDQNDKLATQQKTLSRELQSMTELEARLSRTGEDLLQAQQEAVQARNALQDLQQHHNRLSHDTKAISETLEQVLASTSWKITGPLRKVVSRLRSN